MTYSPKHGVVEKVAKRLRRHQNRRPINLTGCPSTISVTFDDFPRTAISQGARALEAKGWRATFYTSGAFEGTTNHHGPQFVASDLLGLEQSGHEIAGHTLEHVDCTRLSDEELKAQIEGNRLALKSMGVKGDIENFAFPFGQMSPSLKRSLGQHYTSLRGISDGVHKGRADLNELLSCGFYSSTAEAVISRVKRLPKKGCWMTVFTHDIQDSPTQWGCTAGEYSRLLEAIELTGVDVLPIRDALLKLESHNE